MIRVDELKALAESPACRVGRSCDVQSCTKKNALGAASNLPHPRLLRVISRHSVARSTTSTFSGSTAAILRIRSLPLEVANLPASKAGLHHHAVDRAANWVQA